MRKSTLLLFWFFIGAMAHSQTGPIQGHSFLGGKQSVTSGLPSTNYLDGVIPAATITVYLHGTTNKAAIYSDDVNTPLANPFTSNTLASVDPGGWIFWAQTGLAYDVVMSGGNSNPTCSTAPLCYTQPVTLVAQIGGSGGGTGVTTVSAGNDPPLFNTTVTNPSTIPNIAFNPISQAGNTVFGNFAGTTGAPFFANYTCTGLLACSFNSGSNTFNLNVPTASSLSITATTPIKVNGGTGPVSSGTANISCPTCGAPSLRMQPIPPDSNQGVLVFFNNYNFTTNNSSITMPNFGDGKSGFQGADPGGIFDHNVNMSTIWSGAVLPPGLNPANVTAVYLMTYTTYWGIAPQYSCTDGTNNTGPYAWSFSLSGQQSALVNTTGPLISSLSCQANLSMSVFNPQGGGAETINQVALWVEYTGTPVTQTAVLNIAPNLQYFSDTNTLGTNPATPNYLSPLLFTQATSTTPWFLNFGNGQPVFFISDLSNTALGATCGGTGTAGSGYGLCQFDPTSSTWKVIFSGGGSSVDTVSNSDGSLTISPTLGNVVASLNPAHTNSWTVQQNYSASINITSGGGINFNGGGNIGINGNPGTLGQCFLSGGPGAQDSWGSCGGGGGGTVTGSGTTGFYSLWTASTVLGNGSLDDGITRAGFDTFSKPVQVICSTCATQVDLTYNSGHAPSATAGTASFAPDTSGNGTLSENGGSYSRICTASNGACTTGTGLSGMTTGQVPIAATATTVTSSKVLAGSGTGIVTGPTSSTNGDCVQFTGTVGQISDAGAPCGSGGGSLPTATAAGQIIASTGAGTTYAAQPANVYWQSGDTVSAINSNSLCSTSCIYHMTGTVNVTASTSLNAGITVSGEGAGTFNISASQTLTFSAGSIFTSPDSKVHFSGSGAVTFSANQPNPRLKWFAAGDWNGTTGTDDHLAVQKCLNAIQTGQCTLDGVSYYLGTTCAITLPNNYTGITGNYGAGANTTSVNSLVCGSASATVLSLIGSASPNQLRFPILKGFNISRSVAPSTGAIALDLQHLGGLVMEHMYIQDSCLGIHFLDVEGWGTGHSDYNDVQWGYAGVTGYTCGGSGQGIGIEIDGGQSSLDMTHPVIDNNANVLTAPEGIKFVGTSPTDVWLHNPETAGVGIGIDFEASANFWDVTVDDPINDNDTQCIKVNGPSAYTIIGLNIHGGTGWCHAKAFPGVLINNADGVNFIGGQMWDYGVNVTHSKNITVMGQDWLRAANDSAFGDAIDFTDVQNSTLAGAVRIHDNTATIVKLASSSYNNLCGLSLSGTASVGVSMDGSSNNNNCAYSIPIDPTNITTPISDAGNNTTNTAFGTVTYTSSQTASLADNQKLVILNCTASCTYTLPATQPAAKWNVSIISVGSTTASIALGGSDTFNGVTSAPVLNPYKVMPVWANTQTSTDYKGDAPISAGANISLSPSSNQFQIAASGGGGGSSVPVYTGKYGFVANTGSGTSTSITSNSISVASGEVVFAGCRGGTTSISSLTMSDALGNTWHNVGSGTFGTNPFYQIAWSKITTAGADTITCTPNSGSQFMSLVAVDFTWTSTTPSVITNATSNTSGTAYTSPTISPNAQSMTLICASFGSLSGTFFPGPILGLSGSNLIAISASTVSGAADNACEYAIAPWSVAGGVGVLNYTLSVGTTGQIVSMAY